MSAAFDTFFVSISLRTTFTSSFVLMIIVLGREYKVCYLPTDHAPFNDVGLSLRGGRCGYVTGSIVSSSPTNRLKSISEALLDALVGVSLIITTPVFLQLILGLCFPIFSNVLGYETSGASFELPSSPAIASSYIFCRVRAIVCFSGTIPGSTSRHLEPPPTSHP